MSERRTMMMTLHTRSTGAACLPAPSLTPGPSRLTPRAFTFIEVLFSVIILGVGLIMIAGMLPVAIKQNADTRNDLTAKVVCDSGYAYIRALVQQHPEAFPETCGRSNSDNLDPIRPKSPANWPANSMLEKFMAGGTGNLMTTLNNTDDYTVSGGYTNADQLKAGRVVPLSYDVVVPDTSNAYNISTMNATERAQYPLAWHQLNLGDRIGSADPRFQWLAFYRRDEGSRVIKLVIVAMRQQVADVTDRYRVSEEDPTRRGTAQDRSTLPHEGIGDPTGNKGPTNGPFLVPVEIEDCLTEPDKVKFVGTPGINAWDIDVAETGSFLIIAHSPPLNGNNNGDLNRPFRNNGKIFRLAARRDDLDTATMRVWELAPGYDLGSADAGADQIFGTPDDIPDGSMNTTQSFAENATGNRQTGVKQYPVSDTVNADGSRAYAWIIGRGHLDATTASGPFVGATQDLGVLAVDVPLP